MTDLVFIEDTHQYLYKGILLPCVSEILEFVFPNNYNNIPKRIIEEKGKYGTKVHSLTEQLLKKEITIEEIEKMNIDPKIKSSLRQFDKLSKVWIINLKSSEQPVHYKNKYAGTYDLLTTDDYIWDIKTTAAKYSTDLIDSKNEDKLKNKGKLAYDKRLNLQISLYYLAAGIQKDYGYLVWMPKDNLVEIKQVACWPKEKLLEVIEKYEKSKK